MPGTTRDSIDTVLERGEPDVRPRRHRRHPPQAQAAPGDRVLLGAARARGRRARRRRARPRRRERGHRRAGPLGRRHRAEGAVLDARRPLEVGHRRGRDRGRARPARAARCGSARRVIAVSATTDAASTRLLDRVAELFDKHTARIPTAELNRFLGELREARAAAVAEREAAQPPLRDADDGRGRRASASS